MPHTITYQECPACKSSHIEFVFEAKDYTVSKETFAIWQCKNCTLRFTQNAPSQDSIGPYYQSNDYVSHSDTKKGIINQLYHSLRNITLAQKRKLIQKNTGLSRGSLLDIGAGTGAFAHTMKETGWQVTALEPDETARANAKKNYGLTLGKPDELFTQPANSYDAITLWHVLEHVHQLHNYLQTFQQLLKSNGTLVIAVPNYTSYDANFYEQFWAAYDVPRHLFHFSPQSLQLLVQQYAMKVVEMKPMPFDSFYVSMLSETYQNGKNNYARAFTVGLQSNLTASGKPNKSSSVIYIIRNA